MALVVGFSEQCSPLCWSLFAVGRLKNHSFKFGASRFRKCLSTRQIHTCTRGLHRLRKIYVTSRCSNVLGYPNQPNLFTNGPQSATFSGAPVSYIKHSGQSRDSLVYVDAVDATDYKSLLKLRYAFLTTCEGLWEDVSVGLKFDVGYVDSHPGAPYSTKHPVVIGVHGAPGTHEDLQTLLGPLACQGYRVIIPNFPGCGYTQGMSPADEDCFTHSPEAKASFLTDFLTVLGIPKVAMLVGHSTGCYPVIQLCAENSGVQSAMLISPAVHTPFRGIQPYSFIKTLSGWWDVPMRRPFLKAVVYLMAKAKGHVKGKPSHLISALRTAASIDFENVVHNLVIMEQKKFPCCVVYSDDDHLIEMSLFDAFSHLIGVPPDRREVYERDERGTGPGVSCYPKAVLLQGGGHHSMMKYQTVLLSEEQSLLHHIGAVASR